MTDLLQLPHTGLHVPHNRYVLTDFQQMKTRCGIAYNATVHDGERCVGVIENEGNGGGTWLYPATAVDRQAVHDFAAASRMNGEPLSEEEVLDHLITEHETAQEVAKCARRRASLIRGFEEDGMLAATASVSVPPVWLDRTDSPFLPRIARDLEASHPDVASWEFWTGDQWKRINLPIAD
ncbi:hypothetical protein K388_07462 [Streptomyces sp. KhCrAH-43]|uniref:hypothetical protein n=1 Tax=unclassified Streptomyces TaxID=2593676 RepID=UPI00036E0BDD|nr:MULTISPECIES: hypothetical protein [unclassified Streptomyces]MYS37217.1 hypothetical protein [Streptomyces sp. SID4920]MYX67194.1 hypothetical protein [Streptomyces sp. SID8373]RAJ42994.1 hypothetical protein K388_07462 [Streptomyces sp. KhCrAH-43]